jgi:hypothetical protein
VFKGVASNSTNVALSLLLQPDMLNFFNETMIAANLNTQPGMPVLSAQVNLEKNFAFLEVWPRFEFSSPAAIILLHFFFPVVFQRLIGSAYIVVAAGILSERNSVTFVVPRMVLFCTCSALLHGIWHSSMPNHLSVFLLTGAQCDATATSLR